MAPRPVYLIALIVVAVACFASAASVGDLGTGRGDEEDAVRDRDAAAAAPVAKKGGGDAVRAKSDSVDTSGPLWDQPACKAEIKAFECPPEAKENNFAVLLCLTNRGTTKQARAEAMEDGEKVPAAVADKPVLSDRCQHVLWVYKREITGDKRVLARLTEACSSSEDDERALKKCTSRPSPTSKSKSGGSEGNRNGLVLSCMIEKKHGDGTGRPGFSKPCSRVITDIEMVVFSDYRLIGQFMDVCEKDINNLSCGRVDSPDEGGYLSQGKVIECLSGNLKDLQRDCMKETLRVAEFQSDDYHLDRSLFLACQSDRQHLCPKVKSGDGRVYACLMANKMNPEMSHRCQSQLRRRQKMMSQDYRVSHGLTRACRVEIHENKCREGVAKGDEKNIKLAHILLCLEGVVKDEGVSSVAGDCLREMAAHRKMLMEDFNISPEIVNVCKEDIASKCSDGGVGGRTIHCLMKQASQNQLESKQCRKVLATLLREVDVASDWTVDPVLRETCSPVVSEACDPKAPSEVIMSCLMSLAAKRSRKMTNECMNTVLEIQYFLARDFRLDPKLYRTCKDDAERLCHASKNWHMKNDSDARLVFPCLVRYLYGGDDDNDEPNTALGDDADRRHEDDLSDDCADQVERVLEQRALSVRLHPEIEEACRTDLVTLCVSHTKPGEELRCLQNNLDDLVDECRHEVETYSRLEARNTRLNSAVMLACGNIVEKHCNVRGGRHKAMDDGKVMRCLIRYKTTDSRNAADPMPKMCADVVEHWQILAMKDWHFSPAFRKACQKDVRSNCDNPHTKYDIMGCLVDAVQFDMRNGSAVQKISSACRAELKFELLQKHANLRLNTAVTESCQEELTTLCSNDRTLECLRRLKHSQMNPSCRSAVFRNQEEEAYLNRVDHVLMRTCQSEIARHCGGGRQAAAGAATPNAILNCLKENRDDANFDTACRKLVVSRIIQQMSDYRLNPRLVKACKLDLPKFCQHELLPDNNPAYRADSEKTFLEGRVISCLKDSFAQGKKLTKTCKLEIENIMRSATVDIRANPSIFTACPKSIAYCTKKTSVKDANGNVNEDPGRIEECLKKMFHDKELIKVGDKPLCREELAKHIEATRMDVESDIPLRDACSVDLAKFCRDISASHSRGEKISCLRNVLEDRNLRLEPGCEALMKHRLQLYREAVQVVPIHDVRDLYDHLYNSPQRNYLLMILVGIVGTIFGVGMLCGRASKRAMREMKLK